MAPPFRKFAPNPDAPPRVGGWVLYRKPGGGNRKGLVQWIYPDGSMRVKPELGRQTVITPADIARARKGKA